ncbi:hypothetical protein [uncultured Winogradskyella sp.]|uniref:hypothetical protein n=1 Tax=uncultured Winogradskyella sp. TaxID=395353 RepID=UPI0030EF420B|tara:strand:+ start:710 stop:1069 length:360 start_codon:yes stop_codon:yes gene_type:complete
MEHAKSAENEIKSMNYETFLKRGFRFNKRLRRAHKSELANLINYENGIRHKFLPNGVKQLSEIKERLNKAIELIIKNQELDEPNKKALSELNFDVANASTSSDINTIVESGLYFTQEHK